MSYVDFIIVVVVSLLLHALFLFLKREPLCAYNQEKDTLWDNIMRQYKINQDLKKSCDDIRLRCFGPKKPGRPKKMADLELDPPKDKRAR